MDFDVSWMLGRELADVKFMAPASWSFRFGEGVEIRSDTVWHIVVGGRIALSSEDHEQRYGLPSPDRCGGSVSNR